MAKQTLQLKHTREENGKKYYTTVGIVLLDQNQDGSPKVSVKMNSVPVGDWNGWLNAYPPSEGGHQGGGGFQRQGGGGGFQQQGGGGGFQQQQPQQQQQAPQGGGTIPGFNDDIPF